MLRELYFALYAIKKNIQSSAELRTSFLMNILGMAINNTAFIILWGFFVTSVGVIGGWTVADIIGLNGFVTFCFGVVFSVCGGIRKLPSYISSGSFDHFLLSPKGLLLRVATSSFGVSAVGDILYGIICLIVYGLLIKINMYQVLIMLLLVVISTTVFFSVIIVIYSASFYFTDSGSVTRSLFDLFLTPTLFHGGAFQGVMRFIFIFLVPSLLVGTLPVEIIRDTDISKLILVSILSLVWFVISIRLFNRSVRKYESSNFMTFGG